MEIKYWAATDVGRKRSQNEDNFLIDKELRLFVVADGMGGHSSGEVASALAVHTIRDIISSERDIIAKVRDDDVATHVELCTLLEHAVHVACDVIFEKGRQEPEKRGMGTTVVAMVLVGTRGYISYVGDSRIYLLRGGIVYQLTEDHSLMNELIRQGKVTADEFDDSPYAAFRHAMTRAVGPQEHVDVDTLDFDMVPGDAFLLCSDGLYEYTEDQDIALALSLPDINEAPGQLIDLANSRGGKDNITAVVIKVADSADPSDRAAEVGLTLDTLRQIPLFAELSYQQLVRIMNVSRQVPVVAGEVIFTEGEDANELFMLIRGRVQLTVGATPLLELAPGSHFGEMAIIDAAPRPATATAIQDSYLLALDLAAFQDIVHKEPPLAVKLLNSILRVLGHRVRVMTETIIELGGSAPEIDAGAAATTGNFVALSDDEVELEEVP